MKLLSTLCLLFISFYSIAQDSAKGVVIINCWGGSSVQPKIKPPSENGLKGKVEGLNIATASQGVSIRMRCQRQLLGNEDPLYIIDGEVKDLKLFSAVNPNDIESIEILKGAAASAIYGYQAANGVLIVTTKKSNERKFIIKDFLDGSQITGATVAFISDDKKDTLMYAANDSGVVVTDKLKPSGIYEMTVSAVNYQLLNQPLKNSYSKKTQQILLTRDVKIGENVLITPGLGSIIRCYSRFGCGGPRLFTIVKSDSLSEIVKRPTIPVIKAYPNPVISGRVLNIEVNNNNQQKLFIKLSSINGMLLSTTPVNTITGKSTHQLQTDNRWAAGIYFIQLVCEKGRVLASEKVIIQ